MLENWLQPLDPEQIFEGASQSDFPGYSYIEAYEDDFPNLENTHIAIIGLDETADTIRRHFYKLSYHFKGLACADLGNIRKSSSDFLAQVLIELSDGGILPVILGKEHMASAQFVAQKGLRKLHNICIVNERIPYEPDSEDRFFFLNELLERFDDALFNIGMLGYQRHFTPPYILDWLENAKYPRLRLGELEGNLKEAEPIIRDADLFFLHLNAIRGSDAPGVKQQTPNGLFAEDACRLARYAGISDKTVSFSIAGLYKENDLGKRTAQLAGQILWYFLDGFHSRKSDFPVSLGHMTEYLVDIPGYEKPFTFWKSEKSGRWWMQIPAKTGEEMERHRLIPCSYEDYQKAGRGEIPERLLEAIERFKTDW